MPAASYLEQGRESLVKYAQQEKIAEDGEHQTLASSPGLTVIRTLGTLSPKLPQGAQGPKPPKNRPMCAWKPKLTKEQRVQSGHEPKGPVRGFASPNRQKLSNLEMLRILGVP